MDLRTQLRGNAMKVSLIGPVPPYRGGIAHYTFALYRELLALGHEVQLVSFRRQYPRWLYPGVSDRNPGTEHGQIEGAHYWIDSLNPITWISAFMRICKFSPSALVIPWWTPFWAPAWMVLGLLNRLFLKATLVYHCHNVLPHERSRWHSWIARAVLRLGDRFVVASHEQAIELVEMIPDAKVRVCSLPSNRLLAEGHMDRDAARLRLGLEPDVKVILFFGIVRAYKGLHVLLDALPKVRSALPEAYLVIAGEFWESQAEYDRQISELGLTPCVDIYNGYVPDDEVPVFFSAADVLVAPYLSVTGSAVAKMAHPFGIPVVTTWVPDDMGDIEKEPASTYVALPGDAESLADALINALSVDRTQEVPFDPDSDNLSWSAFLNAVLGETPCV